MLNRASAQLSMDGRERRGPTFGAEFRSLALDIDKQ
jgi:hypothetical protein